MHLLLASADDPFDRKAWSGTPFAVREHLAPRVERLSVLHYAKPKATLATGVVRNLLGGRPPRYPLKLTLPALRRYGAELRQAVERHRPDAVLSISSHGLALYRPPVPTFLFSDAPWLAWMQAYSAYQPMPINGMRFAALEAAAAVDIAGVIVGSDWAAGEAQRLYGLSPARIQTAPLGCHWTPSCSETALEGHIAARLQGPLKLLFVGRDWRRKGGPEALAIVHALNRAGTPARLQIIGCRCPLTPQDQAVTEVIGPLSRTDPKAGAQLEALFLAADFLLMPSRAESYGIAHAEAQAFAVPPIALALHAMPSVVKHGETGLLFAPETRPGTIAEAILALAGNRDAYARMARAGRSRFLDQLNWSRFAETVVERISSHCEAQRSRSEAATPVESLPMATSST